ncbi:MAG: DUF4163 domain-containing protein, partial [Heliobacteriaceae bacterium]|nr:DUF4163 domain-containing protein [Heliobacteriaceae bacterium]
MKRVMAVLLAGSLLLANPAAGLAGSSPGDFIDTRGHGAEQEIQAVCKLGLMVGTGVNAAGYREFAPEGRVTRSQAAVVLVRAFKLDCGPVQADYYRDVNNQAWYAGAVLACAANKIFADGEHFYPDRPVSRVELARAIKGGFDAKGISIPMIMVLPVFQDTVDLSPQDLNTVAFAVNTGIMPGDGEYFRPGEPVTRAELAGILNRCAELFAANANPPGGVAIKTKKVKSESETLAVDLEIPVLTGLPDQTVQAAINAAWEEEATKFKEEVASGLEEYIEAAKKQGFPIHQYQAYTRFQVGDHHSDGVLSLYVDYYQYTGGAHGQTARRAYNLDPETGQNLTIGDFFRDHPNSREIINQFIRQEIAANPGDYFPQPETGFAGVADDQGYYLQAGNLVVYFGQYEIAP